MELSSEISAIVTGGASGLGAEVVRMLRLAQVAVVFFDLDEVRGRLVSEETGAFFFPVDITDYESVVDGLEKARHLNGNERILVNCAGIVTAQKIAYREKKAGYGRPHDLDRFKKILNVNLFGTFQMIALSTASMLDLDPIGVDQERGVVINTSSIAALEGQIGQAAYAASKGGVLGLTLPVARDLAPEGIRCCTIMPGVFKTPMVKSFSEEIKQALAAQVPFPSRLGEPSDYAKLVQHIIENPMLNGTAIRLDGALRMSSK